MELVIHSKTRQNYVLQHAKSVGRLSVWIQRAHQGTCGALEDPAEPTADRDQTADHLRLKDSHR